MALILTPRHMLTEPLIHWLGAHGQSLTLTWGEESWAEQGWWDASWISSGVRHTGSGRTLRAALDAVLVSAGVGEG